MIAELGASGKTVGIVTHVAELAEQMPVRYNSQAAERSHRPGGQDVKFRVQPWSPETEPRRAKPEAPAADVDVEVDASRWARSRFNRTGARGPVRRWGAPGRRQPMDRGGGRDPDAGPGSQLRRRSGALQSSARIVGPRDPGGIFTAAAAALPVLTRHARYDVHQTTGVGPEELWLGLQQRMGELEGTIAASHSDAPLTAVDGPLSHHRHVPGVVGMSKPSTSSTCPPPSAPFSAGWRRATDTS